MQCQLNGLSMLTSTWGNTISTRSVNVLTDNSSNCCKDIKVLFLHPKSAPKITRNGKWWWEGRLQQTTLHQSKIQLDKQESHHFHITCVAANTTFWRRRLSVTNFISENNLSTLRLNAPVFALMTTGAFSQNVGKLFTEIKLVTENLLLHLCRSQLRSHWKTTICTVRPDNVPDKFRTCQGFPCFISKLMFPHIRPSMCRNAMSCCTPTPLTLSPLY